MTAKERIEMELLNWTGNIRGGADLTDEEMRDFLSDIADALLAEGMVFKGDIGIDEQKTETLLIGARFKLGLAVFAPSAEHFQKTAKYLAAHASEILIVKEPK